MDQRVCGCVDGFLACAQKNELQASTPGGLYCRSCRQDLEKIELHHIQRDVVCRLKTQYLRGIASGHLKMVLVAGAVAGLIIGWWIKRR